VIIAKPNPEHVSREYYDFLGVHSCFFPVKLTMNDSREILREAVPQEREHFNMEVRSGSSMAEKK
jgi:hypothetical protein